MKSILTIVIFLSLVVSGATQTRNVVVGTNGAVVSPTNFWSADVTNARSGLGLGSAATSAATAFQPSSVNLSNLASNNGLSLTNVQASNIVGVISITSPVADFTNITGTLSVAQGGTSATNAANARQNLGATTVGNALFIATNAAAARTAIGATAIGSSVFTAVDEAAARTFLFLGSAATNTASAFQPSSIVLSNLSSSNGASLTNIPVAGVVGALATNGSAAGLANFPTVALASNVTGTIAISNGGSGSTTAGGARTNLGLGATNDVELTSVFSAGGFGIGFESGDFYDGNQTNVLFTMNGNWYQPITFVEPNTYIAFSTNNTNGAGISRTNLGLGFSALTNTNTFGFNASLYGSGTNPVLYNTNGEVVSPTNFWQVAPLLTVVQYSQPVVNSTNAASNSRNLYLYSLAISTTGVTNTITLPTNTATFFGDVATIIHEGPTNSVTAIRQIGSATNIITINQFQEAVQFLYNGDGWKLADNISQVEPLYFSGTNAAANAAASRTNLGLGTTNNVAFNSASLSGDIVISNTGIYWSGDLRYEIETTTFSQAIAFGGTNTASETRTNLGIPLAALTNTNNVNFQAAIFNTNSAPTNSANVNAINFNTAIHWMEVNVVTNGVTNNFRIPLFK